MTTITETVPLIIRGKVIDAEPKDFGALWAPDPTPYLDDLVLSEPLGLADVHALSVKEIVAYLVELGERIQFDENVHVREAAAMAGRNSLYTREMLEGVYRRLPEMLQRDAVMDYVNHNIDAAFLDGWVDIGLHDRRTAVRAFGARAVHVIAGNSPQIAMQTVIANAVSRGDAIVKLPANDPYTATAIVRTMIDMAPDHPLTKHISLVYWKGGDANIEKRLYNPLNVEKIVAWGGFASMRSIRQYLEPGLDLIALDPKLSASIVGPEAFSSDEMTAEAVARAAADIGYFNQGGCVSARILYVASGTDPDGIERANRFGQMVHDAIQGLPSSLSSPHPAFDPVLREEIAGIKHSPDFKVFGGKNSDGAVIVSQAEEPVDFADRLDCRVANIVPIDKADDALQYLNIHTQTVGIYPDDLKTRLRDQCALRGAQRIVSLGAATSVGQAGPHDAIQVLGRLVRWLRDDTTTSPSSGT